MRQKFLTIALTGLAVFAVQAQDGPYKLIKEIAIGGEGGWDYLNIDSANHRVYVSHQNKAVIVDTQKDAIIGEIADTPGIHGAIAAIPGRVFTSNGRGNNASIVDAKTFQTISKVETGGNPDYIMFEPKLKEVYTFNGRDGSATVINATTGMVVKTIPLGGKPEAGQPDAAAGRVYVNIEDKNTVAVIDVATHAVVANWPIAPGDGATGLAIDTKNKRLFLGTGNKLLLMMDSTNGKIVSQVAAGAGVDSTWFDPGNGYAFASAGDGTVTIAHEDTPAKLTLVQTLKTSAGARTMTLDPATHRIYLAAVKFAPPAADAPTGRGRATIIPNSMTLFVYGVDGK